MNLIMIAVAHIFIGNSENNAKREKARRIHAATASRPTISNLEFSRAETMPMLPLRLSNYFLRGLVYRRDLGEYERETIRRLREHIAYDVIVTYFRSVFIHVL